MTQDQWLILAILTATVAMFLWGRWRHDMVAAGALLACVLAGLVPTGEAFAGFGHPAVITVACVLVLSRGLQLSGAVDVLARNVMPAQSGRLISLMALMGLGAFLSAFMNNVGAMALLMPVAIHLSQRLELTPGQVLMPLAFGTILGGMTTMIGTPPNLIVSGFRSEAGLGSFAMFDFTPIGLAVALAGVLFVALVGWRLVPARKQAGIEGFESGAYVTEVRVLEDSKAAGLRLREIEAELADVDAQIIGMVQREVRLIAANPGRRVHAGDILMIEAEAEALKDVLSILGLKLEEEVKPDKEDKASEEDEKENATASRDKDSDRSGKQEDDDEAEAAESSLKSGDVVLMELAVLPNSPLNGRSASDILLRTRYGVNLLALSREGQRSMKRLRSMAFQSGDLLLMQGPPESISEFASDNGCVPLAERELRIPNKRKIWEASLIMLFAIGGAAFGLLPAAVAFALGVLASMALRTVPPQAVYHAIDWPVIVLLAALIPVAGAMATTGTADLIARLLIENVAQGHAVVGLALILVVTMFLSDLMNNAATAAVMCPIAIGTANALGVSPDAFLMAVAIGASCAFLTPIGHQNNTLILGPGGFRFSDYWRLGLPLEIIVVAIAVPLLLVVWPL
ncbi:SLC13 family permease [Ectothiorhodospira variabilis]|uniref:SLC13 family permease n=1 Tax=Ectothiorhodospira variabilis TaxID=505694 RepID=UPI001EFB8CD8|nr:SLC13 family permease [Ectothiorhodospira variabilis]MCG5494239.1 SLC13 family permease [Ectothiorhodospira variabilis]MCG5504815.1 SLC13 family permease [Ectothiorhodospira variabilis]MCG5507972.1 SLC13 family permease [Ectothiorhodospira variabilis]